MLVYFSAGLGCPLEAWLLLVHSGGQHVHIPTTASFTEKPATLTIPAFL